MATTAEEPNKPHGRENDNLKPYGDGQTPRPATEPGDAKGSCATDKTLTDPATGKPNDSGAGI